MAGYVTQKERTRRLVLLISCIVANVLLIVGCWYLAKMGNETRDGIKEGEDQSKKRSIAEMEREVREIEDRYDQLETSIVKFSEPIGWRMKVSDSADRYNRTAIYANKLKDLLNDWTKILRDGYKTRDQVERVSKYTAWDKDVEGKVSVHMYLKDLFKELEEIYQKLKGLEESQVELKKKAGEEEKAALDLMRKTDDENREKIEGKDKKGGLIGDIAKILDEIVATQKAEHEKIAEQEKMFRVKFMELGALKEKNTRELIKRDREVEPHRKKLQEIKDAEKIDLAAEEDKKEPDAEVVFADNENDLVYVSFTHKDRVYPGMQFDVFGIYKAGIKKHKGIVKLTRIGDEYSVAVVEGRREKNDLFQKGDFLHRADYIPTRPNHFFFIGENAGRFSREELIVMLQKKGDVVHTKLDNIGLFVICGDKYEEDPLYQTIMERFTATLKERDLYVYLGIEW